MGAGAVLHTHQTASVPVESIDAGEGVVLSRIDLERGVLPEVNQDHAHYVGYVEQFLIVRERNSIRIKQGAMQGHWDKTVLPSIEVVKLMRECVGDEDVL